MSSIIFVKGVPSSGYLFPSEHDPALGVLRVSPKKTETQDLPFTGGIYTKVCILTPSVYGKGQAVKGGKGEMKNFKHLDEGRYLVHTMKKAHRTTPDVVAQSSSAASLSTPTDANVHNAHISWNVHVEGDVRVKGNASVEGGVDVKGDAKVVGDLTVGGKILSSQGADWAENVQKAFGEDIKGAMVVEVGVLPPHPPVVRTSQHPCRMPCFQ